MMIQTTVSREGFQGVYYDGDFRKVALIVVSGSDGGMHVAEGTARRFSTEGIPSLAVAYYKTPQTSRDLADIPVEYIERRLLVAGKGL